VAERSWRSAWRLEVTAPWTTGRSRGGACTSTAWSRVRRSFAAFQREYEVDDAMLARTRVAIADAVAAGPLTRQQVGEHLAGEGLPGEGFALGLVLTDAELEAVVCSGPLAGNDHTYAPFAERDVGMVLVDGQMVGGMRRTVTDTRARFDLQLFRTLAADERVVLLEAADRYGRFLDREPVVTGLDPSE
jgi:hypothetical protein